MSNQVLRITLDNSDPLINSKELGQIIVNTDDGTVDYVDSDGTAEHISVFDPSSATNIYMEKSVYDVNPPGLYPSVDNADSLGGISSTLYATKSWVQSNVTGDMSASTYDINNNGIVDNSEKLGGQLPSYYASVAWVQSLATGDMKKSTYDTNNDGVVNDSSKLNGQFPAYYLDYANFVGTPPATNSIKDIGDVFTTMAPGDGEVLTWDALHARWDSSTVTSDFINLTDTPSSYAGEGGKILSVNASGTGLEFIVNSGSGNLLEADDCNEGVKQLGDVIQWNGTDWVNTQFIDQGTF